MAALRYLLFIAVGLVVASVLFLVLSVVVSANFEAGVGFVERWIVRATCDQYELAGTVRDAQGRPVPYAVVEASYLDERLTTRSDSDGSFMLSADEAVCDRRPPRDVQVLVMADEFRPKRTAVPFEAGSVELTLDAREFRP
jgi:Carboxypeptidase regulatory-like domain